LAFLEKRQKKTNREGWLRSGKAVAISYDVLRRKLKASSGLSFFSG
jgi:hypothetical protein